MRLVGELVFIDIKNCYVSGEQTHCVDTAQSFTVKARGKCSNYIALSRLFPTFYVCDPKVVNGM